VGEVCFEWALEQEVEAHLRKEEKEHPSVEHPLVERLKVGHPLVEHPKVGHPWEEHPKVGHLKVENHLKELEWKLVMVVVDDQV
jgi:hypothetical protein